MTVRITLLTASLATALAALYRTVTTGHRRLLFETSAAGRIASISTGRIPEVDCIEGCA